MIIWTFLFLCPGISCADEKTGEFLLKMNKADELYEEGMKKLGIKMLKDAREIYFSLEKEEGISDKDPDKMKVRARIGILEFILDKKYKYAFKRFEKLDIEELSKTFSKEEVKEVYLYSVLSYLGDNNPNHSNKEWDPRIYMQLTGYSGDEAEKIRITKRYASKGAPARIEIIEYLFKVAGMTSEKGDCFRAFYMYATLLDLSREYSEVREKISVDDCSVGIFQTLEKALEKSADEYKFLATTRKEELQDNLFAKVVSARSFIAQRQFDKAENILNILEREKNSNIKPEIRMKFRTELRETQVDLYRKNEDKERMMNAVNELIFDEYVNKETKEKYKAYKTDVRKQEEKARKIEEAKKLLTEADKLFDEKKWEPALKQYEECKSYIIENNDIKHTMRTVECLFRLEKLDELLNYSSKIPGEPADKLTGENNLDIARIHMLRGRAFAKKYQADNKDIKLLVEAYKEHNMALRLDPDDDISAYYLAAVGRFLVTHPKDAGIGEAECREMKEEIMDACEKYLKLSEGKSELKEYRAIIEEIKKKTGGGHGSDNS